MQFMYLSYPDPQDTGTSLNRTADSLLKFFMLSTEIVGSTVGVAMTDKSELRALSNFKAPG